MSLIQFGAFRFLIASDMCTNGVVPFASISNPSVRCYALEFYISPILWLNFRRTTLINR